MLLVCELADEVAEEGFVPFAGAALKAMLAKDNANIIERKITPIFDSVLILTHTFLIDLFYVF